MKLSAISGGQFPNVALLCRDVIAYTERSHLSPTTSDIVVRTVVHRKTVLPRYPSNSVGCNTLHLASKVVCKGIPLDPCRGYGNLHAGTASPCAYLPLILSSCRSKMSKQSVSILINILTPYIPSGASGSFQYHWFCILIDTIQAPFSHFVQSTCVCHSLPEWPRSLLPVPPFLLQAFLR